LFSITSASTSSLYASVEPMTAVITVVIVIVMRDINACCAVYSRPTDHHFHIVVKRVAVVYSV